MPQPERLFRIVHEETFSGKLRAIVYTESVVRESFGVRYTIAKLIPSDRLASFLRSKGVEIEEVDLEDS